MRSQFVVAAIEYVIGTALNTRQYEPLFPEGLIIKCNALPRGSIIRLLEVTRVQFVTLGIRIQDALGMFKIVHLSLFSCTIRL